VHRVFRVDKGLRALKEQPEHRVFKVLRVQQAVRVFRE
jgi:hypothetical protein